MRKVVGSLIVLAALVGMNSAASAEGRSHHGKSYHCNAKYHSKYHCKRWYRKHSAKAYFARQKKNGS